eukprot:5233537-Amphidinium_carterae.1
MSRPTSSPAMLWARSYARRKGAWRLKLQMGITWVCALGELDVFKDRSQSAQSNTCYRGNFYYDLAKTSNIRMAFALHKDVVIASCMMIHCFIHDDDDDDDDDDHNLDVSQCWLCCTVLVECVTFQH